MNIYNKRNSILAITRSNSFFLSYGLYSHCLFPPQLFAYFHYGQSGTKDTNCHSHLNRNRLIFSHIDRLINAFFFSALNTGTEDKISTLFIILKNTKKKTNKCLGAMICLLKKYDFNSFISYSKNKQVRLLI